MIEYEQHGYELVDKHTYEKKIKGYWLRFHVSTVPRAEVVVGGVSLHFTYRITQQTTIESIELQVQKVVDSIKNVGLIRTAEAAVIYSPEELAKTSKNQA